MQSGAGNRLSAFQNPDTVAQTYDSVGMQSPASQAQLDALLGISHTTAKTSTIKFKYLQPQLNTKDWLYMESSNRKKKCCNLLPCCSES